VGSVSPELLGVSLLPVASLGGTDLGGHVALLLEATGLLAASGQATLLSVSVLGGDDPVDLGVLADGLVVGVNHDNLVELVGSVLGNPVGVEDAQVGGDAADALLSNVLVGLLLLELADTVVTGLTVNAALADHSFAATTADTDSVDDVALRALVSKSAGLVGTGGALAAVDSGQLSVLPGADSEDESHEVGLLLFPQFFKVLVGSHGCFW